MENTFDWYIQFLSKPMKHLHMRYSEFIQNILLSSPIVPWLMLESTADLSETFIYQQHRRRHLAMVQENCHIHMEILSWKHSNGDPWLKSTNNCSKAAAYLNIYRVANSPICWKFYPSQLNSSTTTELPCNVAWADFIYQTFYSHTNNIKLMFGILRSRSRNSKNVNMCW